MRQFSKIAPGWWDYTTLDDALLNDAANLTLKDIKKLKRPGFNLKFYDTLESFYLAEAMEYIYCWTKSTSGSPAGICGPIGPTEQLPLVAQIVNDLEIDIKDGHFWAMDEWTVNGKAVPVEHPLSFRRTDLDQCFNRINSRLRMPDAHLHFINDENITSYSESFNQINRLVMQGGQGDVKHWAFNDPVPRTDKYSDHPPSFDEYTQLSSRIVDLHPATVMQNARTSCGGAVHKVPIQAATVGPVETWKSEKISIWHPGTHDNAFGMRLTTYMISKGIIDSSVPMSLLAKHPDVQFNFYLGALTDVKTEMH